MRNAHGQNRPCLLLAAPRAGAAQTPEIPADLLIELERTACFGSCPIEPPYARDFEGVVALLQQALAKRKRDPEFDVVSPVAAPLAPGR
jgi:hypothetical protein